MKYIVLLTCLVVIFACAAGETESVDAELNEEEFVLDQEPEIHVNDDGSFLLRLRGEDGTAYEEEGVVLTDEKTGEEVVITKKSTYSYLGKDGKLARLAYDVDKPVEADV